MVLPVTLVLAGSCALINLWLAVRCVRRRLGAKIMNGDGGDAIMQVRGRAHANFVEYAPFVLVMTGAIELARGASPWLWGVTALFVLARIAHPIGMERPAPNPFRAGGALVTWFVTAGLAAWALAIAYDAGARPAPGEPIETIVPAG